MRSPATRAAAAGLAVGVVVVALVLPESAFAAGPQPLMAHASILGGIFGGIGHVLLGAFSWTVNLAEKFVLTTIGALVKLLIPRSWAHKGAQIMGWIVAVPDYAGQVKTPGGGHQYGFAGINDLRQLFMWLGIAIAPLTLTHATARAMVDDSDPIGIPILRVLGVAAGILVYPYLWAQGAAVTDQVTHLILGLPAVTDGLQKLMDYAVDGVALGGWQLIDLSLMGAIGIELLGLIFMKVALILLGALLYATGPLMIGLVPTRFGHSIARAWMSAVMFLLAIGVAWATIFAVGALLIKDASTAGPLLAGNSAFGNLVGGLILAVAGLVALWLCLRVAREAGGLLRMQLGGMLALGHGSLRLGSSTVGAGIRERTSGASLRTFGNRLARGTLAAGGELAAAVPGGRQMRMAMIGAGHVGRHGLAGTAATGARAAADKTAGPAATMLGRSRAGAVAVRMARAGTAAITDTPPSTQNGTQPQPPGRDTPASTSSQQAGMTRTTKRNEHPSPTTNTRSQSAGTVTRGEDATARRTRAGIRPQQTGATQSTARGQEATSTGRDTASPRPPAAPSQRPQRASDRVAPAPAKRTGEQLAQEQTPTSGPRPQTADATTGSGRATRGATPPEPRATTPPPPPRHDRPTNPAPSTANPPQRTTRAPADVDGEPPRTRDQRATPKGPRSAPRSSKPPAKSGPDGSRR